MTDIEWKLITWICLVALGIAIGWVFGHIKGRFDGRELTTRLVTERIGQWTDAQGEAKYLGDRIRDREWLKPFGPDARPPFHRKGQAAQRGYQHLSDLTGGDGNETDQAR